jgi:hypothetical protein
MPFCVFCQLMRSDTAVFCPNCGQRLVPSPSLKFDLQTYLQQLQHHGWQRIKLRQDADHTKPRRYQQQSWDAALFLEDIWRALTRGGFSYFTHVGESRQESFTSGVLLTTEHTVTTHTKAPILLPTERLQHVAEIHAKGLAGQLFFTGQRFLYEVTRMELAIPYRDEVGKHFIFTQPLFSLWIKPDFTELLQRMGRHILRETGTFRKKRYRRMMFRVNAVKRLGRGRPHTVYCGYVWDGPDGEHVDDDTQFAFVIPEETLSAEQFALELRELIRQAASISVANLLAYTYRCHARSDAFIATDYTSGTRLMSEQPYAYWGTFPILV